jgi:hypothetical protein
MHAPADRAGLPQNDVGGAFRVQLTQGLSIISEMSGVVGISCLPCGNMFNRVTSRESRLGLFKRDGDGSIEPLSGLNHGLGLPD